MFSQDSASCVFRKTVNKLPVIVLPDAGGNHISFCQRPKINLADKLNMSNLPSAQSAIAWCQPGRTAGNPKKRRTVQENVRIEW